MKTEHWRGSLFKMVGFWSKINPIFSKLFLKSGFFNELFQIPLLLTKLITAMLILLKKDNSQVNGSFIFKVMKILGIPPDFSRVSH